MATQPFNRDALDTIKAGDPVAVWSDLLGEWLYWVRGESERRWLQRQGCVIPIYTLGELAIVAKMPQKDIRAIHRLKAAFNGIVTK